MGTKEGFIEKGRFAPRLKLGKGNKSIKHLEWFWLGQATVPTSTHVSQALGANQAELVHNIYWHI